MPKFNKSIYFTDKESHKRFLFKVLNIGDERNDELKFHFKKSNDPFYIIKTNNEQNNVLDAKIISFSEITYHHDGSLLYKYPKSEDGYDEVRDNPYGEGFRRSPLNKIKLWEPIFKLSVLNYKKCTTKASKNKLIVPFKDNIFNGESFDCYIFIGNKICSNPPNKSEFEALFRIEEVTKNLDLICWFKKSDSEGNILRLNGNSIINKENHLKILVDNILVENGAIILELTKINNGAWNTDFLKNGMNLNLNRFKHSNKELFLRAKIKENPQLLRLYEELGIKKSFPVKPEILGKRLNVNLIGFMTLIDEEEYIEVYTN